MTKLIILDRDGVINYESIEYVKSPEEWIPIPGSLEAIAKLNQAGYRVAIATNQSGIGRGLYDIIALNRIHQKMETELAKVKGSISGIFFCPHSPHDLCQCRKPKPGLLEQIANTYKVDFKKTQTFFIGDSLRDLEVADLVGCKPILILTGFGKKTRDELPEKFKDVPIYADLPSAVNALINNHVNAHP